MARIDPLAAEALHRSCDPALLPFDTTAELDDLEEIPGQERAVEAIHFSTEVELAGYNLFVLGPSGSGRHHAVREFLKQHARNRPVPPDICYVNNFEDPRKPVALSPPAGLGAALKEDIAQFVQDAQAAIPAAFQSDDFRTRKESIEEEFRERQEAAFNDIQKRARDKDIGILQTPTGIAIAPLKDGEAIGPDEFKKLPEDERKRIEEVSEAFTRELRKAMRAGPRRARELREKIRALEREVTTLAVHDLIEALTAKYADQGDIVTHLERVEADVVENASLFLDEGGDPPPSIKALFGGGAGERQDRAAAVRQRYAVNLIVDHDNAEGAPVVFENQPTFAYLVGQIEHQAQFGTLVTDFTLIKAGALHRANGGYLVVDAREVLTQPYAWDALKRALKSGEIRIRSLGESLSLISTASLEPESVPLDVKTVLIGERMLYYLLQAYDPDFQELFKIAADFEDRVSRSDDHVLRFARLIATLARRDELRPLDRAAIARVIEHSSRLAGDTERLTGEVRQVADLVREANTFAARADRPVIGAAEIGRAIDARIRRASRIRDRLQEEILRGTLMIDTDGARAGQINGLAVWQTGELAFAHPVRITARVSLGGGDVVDIEREVELGGPIHSKGVLILSSFLGARYVTDQPLSLTASLVFEQSYGGVEGDSASAAELCALLSALADAPINQALAITGSVNQHGEIQAIGGVNEKIEGFFDICRERGLTGGQGVLIPAANVQHLMLRQDVVEAAAAGQFAIYGVADVDECLELLTGQPAGAPDESGEFPADSINARVRERLTGFATSRQAFGASGHGEGEAES
jgi:lon-related putative ATP-dependent protease